MFTRNVGGIDRAVRLVLGALLLAIGLALVRSSGWGSAIALAGLATFATGVTGFCAPYRWLGISTARRPARDTHDRVV